MSTSTPVRRRRRAAPATRAHPHPPGRRPGTWRPALALTGAVLLSVGAVAGCTPDAPGRTPDVSDSASAPATAPATAPAEAVPLLEDQPPDERLVPGRYAASPFDQPPSAPFLPVLTVPEGYRNAGGAGVGAEAIEHGVVWLWDVRSVYTHPCDPAGVPEPVGPTVADLAGALAAQPLREGTDPVPVTVGGYDGLYVELSTPDDLDFTTCRIGYFHSWPGRSQRDAGQVDRLWIVDVAGQRVTFDLSHPPGATPEQVHELEEIVTTATFTRRGDT